MWSVGFTVECFMPYLFLVLMGLGVRSLIVSSRGKTFEILVGKYEWKFLQRKSHDYQGEYDW